MMTVVTTALFVRPAGPHDAVLMAELNGIVQGIHHTAHPDRFLPSDPQRVEPVFREWLEPGKGQRWSPEAETRAWICESAAGEAVGYVIAVYRERPQSPFTSAHRWVELDQIAVREEDRSSGAGRLLALAVVEWARQVGVDTLELTVWEFNLTAQGFFEGLGFEPLQQRRAWRLPPV